MTDRQPPEEHPFSEFLRPPSSRREARDAERAAGSATGPIDPLGGSDAAGDGLPPGFEPDLVPVGARPSVNDEPFGAEPQPSSRRAARVAPADTDLFASGFTHEPPPRRRRRGVVALAVVLALLLVLGGVVTALYFSFESQIQSLFSTSESQDYSGEGTGEVTFVIADGDVGEVIGDKLAEADIIADSGTFYRLLLNQAPAPVFQPGTYSMASQMSAQAALTRLTDGAHRIENTITIPEGTAAEDVLVDLADITGIPLAEFEAVAADYAALGVPAEAPSIEGFLFPATYTFQPGTTPTDMLKTMVDRSFESLDDAGVAPADRFRVITLASIIQREAGLAADYPKVSRVFLNRIADGMLLQSDATVAYGTGNTHTVETTSAERADATNLYNTYVHEGLPVGPIGNPGDVAIDAAIHPSDGPWIYFVTWNLDTGETIFSTTLDEHNAAVEKWQEWMAENGQ